MYDPQQRFGQPPIGPAVGGGYGAMPTDQERQFAMFAHLSPLIIGVFGPIIFMLIDVGGRPSPFVKHHAKQSLIWCVALIVVSIFTCGVGGLVMMVWQVIAGLEANKGAWYVYPGCARFADP